MKKMKTRTEELRTVRKKNVRWVETRERKDYMLGKTASTGRETIESDQAQKHVL